MLDVPKTSEGIGAVRESLNAFIQTFTNGTIQLFICGLEGTSKEAQVSHTKPSGAEYGGGPIRSNQPYITIFFQEQGEIVQLDVQVAEKEGGALILLLYERPALQEFVGDVTRGPDGLKKLFAKRLRERHGVNQGTSQDTSRYSLDGLEGWLNALGDEGFVEYAKKHYFPEENSVIKIFHN